MSSSRQQLDQGYDAADAGDVAGARAFFEAVLAETSSEPEDTDSEACRDEALACLARLYRVERAELERIDPISFYRGLHTLLDHYDPHPSVEKAEAMQSVAEALAEAGQCEAALRVMQGVIERYGAFLGEVDEQDECCTDDAGS